MPGDIGSRVRPKRVTRHLGCPGRIAPAYSVTTDGQKILDGQIMNWIVGILEDYNSAYGYQKLTIGLRRQHQLTINRSRNIL